MIDPVLASLLASPVQSRHYWEMFWVSLGFVAQAIFAARFLVQWIASEREGRSTIPIAFWYLSVVGGGMLLTYAIYRRDPVFILGQATGFAIYMRNLVLIKKEKKRHA